MLRSMCVTSKDFVRAAGEFPERPSLRWLRLRLGLGPLHLRFVSRAARIPVLRCVLCSWKGNIPLAPLGLSWAGGSLGALFGLSWALSGPLGLVLGSLGTALSSKTSRHLMFCMYSRLRDSKVYEVQGGPLSPLADGGF